jgi:hypothetical protein
MPIVRECALVNHSQRQYLRLVITKMDQGVMFVVKISYFRLRLAHTRYPYSASNLFRRSEFRLGFQ